MGSNTVDPRRTTIDRFAAAAKADDRVAAAFLGGSFASGKTDEHSDLDIYLVVDDERYDAFFADREAFVRTWADPVFLDTTVNFEGFGFDMVHFVNRDGVTGELAFARPDGMLAMHGGPHETLVDRRGLLDGVSFPLYEPSLEERRGAVDRALTWFWLDAITLSKSLARGRLRDAMASLSRMRERTAAMIAEVQPEADRERLREQLLPTYVPADPAGIGEAAERLIALHREVGQRTGLPHSVEYPAGLAFV